MGFLKKLLRKKTTGNVVVFDAVIKPDSPFYVIGDVHGCADLLEVLMEQVGEDSPLKQKTKIVFVGDYIDRGEQSATVLRWVKSLSEDPDFDVTCLMGNHEDMLLKFLDDPVERGARWLRYGGLQTLSSFGVGAISDNSAAAIIAARDNLRDSMGTELITWVQELPVSFQNGNVAVVHAGADPEKPIPDQHPKVLKWGHKYFNKKARVDGVWVVHGHTIVDAPYDRAGRIAIDTGAFATGVMTAVCIAPGGVRYLQT